MIVRGWIAVYMVIQAPFKAKRYLEYLTKFEMSVRIMFSDALNIVEGILCRVLCLPLFAAVNKPAEIIQPD